MKQAIFRASELLRGQRTKRLHTLILALTVFLRDGMANRRLTLMLHINETPINSPSRPEANATRAEIGF
jgi:hypothetical protein